MAQRPERKFALNFDQDPGAQSSRQQPVVKPVCVDDSNDPTEREQTGSYYRHVDFMTAGQKYAARRANKQLSKLEAKGLGRQPQQRKRHIQHVDLGDGEDDEFGPGQPRKSSVTRLPESEAVNQFYAQTARPQQKQTAFVVPERHEPEPSTMAAAAAGIVPTRPVASQSAPVDAPVVSGAERLAYQAVTGNARSPLLVNRQYRPPLPPEEKPNRETSSIAGSGQPEAAGDVNDPLKHFDSHILELIQSEIMCSKTNVSWEDISGLDKAKQALREIVVWPFLRPDLFHGLRAPAKGVLLFGPPGTGKTMIGRCVASECRATFFNISASSITSKWVGEGEKLVRALFAVARTRLPAVIFIDEIDSILSSRSDSEHESSRRIKTEFLVQLDGVSTSADERLLVLAATNRPQELDEAARRRFTKRLYIGLPTRDARAAIVHRLLRAHSHSLTDEQRNSVADMTQGYSGADMRCLCQETAFEPLRALGDQLAHVPPDKIRPILLDDFSTAIGSVRATVTEADLLAYERWNAQFGSIMS